MRHHLTHCLKNEDGISLIPVMILLFIATIIGIAASSTSNFEIKVAANDRFYKKNFFRADGANQQGAQLIQNAKDNGGAVLRDRPAYATWLSLYDDSVDYLAEAAYVYTGGIANTKLLVTDHGPAPGAEISMGSKMMHSMSVYGRYDSPSGPGRVIIESEYRVKF